MPKTIHTPRDELICGKIDEALAHAKPWRDVKFIYLLEEIRKDAERMEAALVRRKDEVSRLEKELEETKDALIAESDNNAVLANG